MTSSKGNVATPPELWQPEGNLTFLLISLINPSSLIYFLKIKVDLEWLYINTGRSQEGPGAVYGILCSIWVCVQKEEKESIWWYRNFRSSCREIMSFFLVCLVCRSRTSPLIQLHSLISTVIPNVIPWYPLSLSFHFTIFIVTSTSVLGSITPMCPRYEVRSEWQAPLFTTDRKTPLKLRKNITILFL